MLTLLTALNLFPFKHSWEKNGFLLNPRPQAPTLKTAENKRHG